MPTPCGRRTRCSNIIKAGQIKYYVETYANCPGRYVCRDCYDHYEEKSTTALCSAFINTAVASSQARQNPSAVVPSSQTGPPDSQSVKRVVNGAQRKGPIQFQVTPMGRIQGVQTEGVNMNKPNGMQGQMEGFYRQNVPQPGLMAPPPPPIIYNSMGNQGASAYAANAWNAHPYQAQPASNPAMLGSPYGYSPVHQNYGIERQKWAAVAYSSSLAERISLLVQVHHEVPAKSKSVMVGNLSEGLNDVPARSTAAEIINKAISLMRPLLIRNCPNFPWDFDNMWFKGEHMHGTIMPRRETVLRLRGGAPALVSGLHPNAKEREARKAAAMKAANDHRAKRAEFWRDDAEGEALV
ncbi:hypothetical protein PLICRDRAFT_28725 [Plicaturopsis crispa FD-325 SS-3]|nr:hypothetical protein PLICRDRAFT_28725 [Plicaturopsis crispa FD-325 SS-3]